MNVILAALARHALTTVGGALVVKGYVTPESAVALVDWLVGGSVLIGGVGWSIWEKHRVRSGGGQ